MDPLGSLAIAVEAMYFLTFLPWEAALHENFPVATPGIEEEVLFHPTAAPDADDQMETQHMVCTFWSQSFLFCTVSCVLDHFLEHRELELRDMSQLS